MTYYPNLQHILIFRGHRFYEPVMMLPGVDLSGASSIRLQVRAAGGGDALLELDGLTGQADGSVLVEVPATADIPETTRATPHKWDCFVVGVDAVNPGKPIAQGDLKSQEPVTEGSSDFAPVNIYPPQVSGSPSVGGTLSGTDGVWSASPAPTYTVEHVVDGVVAGTGATYDPVEADEGKPYIRRVTATNSEGSASADSLALILAGGAGDPVDPLTNQLADNLGNLIVDNLGNSITFLN